MIDEYLITNKLGAFSSSTFHSGNTRKYHGLLVFADEDVKRYMAVNRLEEELVIGGKSFFLSTNKYKNNVTYPEGSRFLSKFENENNEVVLEYRIEDLKLKITKTIVISEYSNQVEVKYKIVNPDSINYKFTVKPLVSYRNFHDLLRFDDAFGYKTNLFGNIAEVKFNDEYSLSVKSNGDFSLKNEIYRDFYYKEEQERGYDCYEDLVCPIEINFDNKSDFFLKFSVLPELLDSPKVQKPIRLFHRQKPQNKSDESVDSALEDFEQFLRKKSQQFIIDSKNRASIIAGFHWFEDWGRDTFISFRGILLLNGHLNLARDILLSWKPLVNRGLIPNRPGLNEYNSIDATLLYISSIYSYWQVSFDVQTIRKLMKPMRSIIENLIIGTKYGIKTNQFGFLESNSKNHGLTWMDAVIDGNPVTNRSGAPVEIQMLWFNAINVYRSLSKIVGKIDESFDYYLDLLSRNIKHHFEEKFYLKNKSYLGDYILDGEMNEQIRPNPVIGFAQHFQILDRDLALKSLHKIEKELLTAVGLRTLSPRDNQYKPEYKGTQTERDHAYHQGTVWPWPLGYYLKSFIVLNKHTEKSKEHTKKILLDFWNEMNKQELKFIPEVFSAETLKPNGCLSQAWNYATLLESFNELKIN